ncbi:MAG TPA: hypothetical protein ENI66_00430 [Candidatus Yonathbacteria bacterium]|nr:hypothetical protein [Candidatus Yonathbacteria bacterium]
MKKEIKEVDEKRKIVRITTADERWYLKEIENKEGLPEYKAVPSVTWICDSYPKGIGFYKWLADKGWDEAQAIKESAGGRGSKVHNAISAIICGEEVRIDSEFSDSKGKVSELTGEEIDAVLSFINWNNKVKPRWIAWDQVIFSSIHNFAGTFDAIAEIDGVFWLIDFKTSQQVWASHHLQVSSYREAIMNGENKIEGIDGDLKLAVLQVGYRLNKNNWKWTEIENKFELFKAAQLIWKNERATEKSMKGFSQKEYPIILSEKITTTTNKK